MTRFGPWSTLLGIGAGFAALVAILLLTTRANHIANRFLALLLLGFALKLLPYVLGFAGYYDAYPWLSFAPLDMGLALGPLLYLHVRCLVHAELPRGWIGHFVPVAIQVAYQALVFAQPQATKDHWNDAFHRDWIDPSLTLLALVSFGAYLGLAIRAYRDYQSWLDAHLSNREQFRMPWLRNVLLTLVAAWPAWVLYELVGFGAGFDYYDRFPLYAGFTALVFYLGLEGWRHADLRYPVTRPALPPPDVREAPALRDWGAQGRAWLARTRTEGWWRDPDLGLDRLAQHLGTNTSYLSRAFNEGLGTSFNDAINGLRVDEVCAQLDAGSARSLIDLALDAGFNSKTSFNRCFKARTGATPSQYRDRGRTKD